jgi:hypothetical protein
MRRSVAKSDLCLSALLEPPVGTVCDCVSSSSSSDLAALSRGRTLPTSVMLCGKEFMRCCTELISTDSSDSIRSELKATHRFRVALSANSSLSSTQYTSCLQSPQKRTRSTPVGAKSCHFLLHEYPQGQFRVVDSLIVASIVLSRIIVSEYSVSRKSLY